MDNLELPLSKKLDLEHKIYLSWIRNDQNVDKVKSDINLQDEDYIRSVLEKWAKRLNRDVKLKAADFILKNFFIDRMKRVFFLETSINHLMDCMSGKKMASVSMCCKAPMNVIPPAQGSPAIHKCTACNNACSQDNIKMIELLVHLKAYLELHQNETSNMVQQAIDLGFVGVESPGVVINQKQNFVTIGTGSEFADLSKMTPLEREQIRKRIESDIQKEVDDFNAQEKESADKEREGRSRGN